MDTLIAKQSQTNLIYLFVFWNLLSYKFKFAYLSAILLISISAIGKQAASSRAARPAAFACYTQEVMLNALREIDV